MYVFTQFVLELLILRDVIQFPQTFRHVWSIYQQTSMLLILRDVIQFLQQTFWHVLICLSTNLIVRLENEEPNPPPPPPKKKNEKKLTLP